MLLRLATEKLVSYLPKSDGRSVSDMSLRPRTVRLRRCTNPSGNLAKSKKIDCVNEIFGNLAKVKQDDQEMTYCNSRLGNLAKVKQDDQEKTSCNSRLGNLAKINDDEELTFAMLPN